MRVEGTTDKMMDFLKKNGINLSELSRIAGIPYKLLYASVRDKNRKRELREGKSNEERGEKSNE